MGNKLLTYKRMVNTMVIITETLICGGLFGLFYSWAQGSSWEKTMGVPQTQIMLTLMLCYFITAINTGVSLYNRKVYAYRIVGHVVQNMFVFAILAGCILTVGHYTDAWSKLFAGYLATLLVCLTAFRLILRYLVKSYRSRGGNLRFVVLVGSYENNVELYRELTEASYAGFRVIGYFDHEPSNRYPKECPYLGRPEDVNAYLGQHPKVHFLFCCLPSKDRDVIIPIINFCENHLVRFYSVPNVHNSAEPNVLQHAGQCALPEPAAGSAEPAGKQVRETDI